MSMIGWVVHREEDVTRGLTFADRLQEGETITTVDLIRVRRMVDRQLQDVTPDVLEMDGDRAAFALEDGHTVVFRKVKAADETKQPPGTYYVTIRLRTSMQEEPVGYDVGGVEPVLVITDGLRPPRR